MTIIDLLPSYFRRRGSEWQNEEQHDSYLISSQQQTENSLQKIRYPGEKLSPTEAIQRYRSELLEQNGKDFIPYTFQLPVSLVVATVADDYSLIDLVALDEEMSRPHEIVRLFWEGWRKKWSATACFIQRPWF